MSVYIPNGFGSRFQLALDNFASRPDEPLLSALSEERIQQIAAEEGVSFGNQPGDVYTPTVTLWGMLTQAASASKSCVGAVARIIVLVVALGRPAPSANTGAYCKARAKLPETFLKRLAVTVGTEVEDRALDSWRWLGHRTVLADGCAMSMADTPENQEEYPQSSRQQPGVGFPLMRVVVFMAFATAVLLDAAQGPHQGKESGETALFRQMLDSLRTQDVVVADRFYCSYWMVALLQERGVHVAFRLHQRRHYDFRRGQRLGTGDHVVVWVKPACPEWMDAEMYARLPDTLTVREVRVHVEQPGSRTRVLIVATTLLDAEAYPQLEIGDLYHQRWHVELDIRSMKQTMRMEHLPCKTPAMVRRELWAHFLAYNLVRQTLAAAAQKAQRSPRQLSMAGALHILEEFRWSLLGEGSVLGSRVVTEVLIAVGTHEVGDRPDRAEPRKVKRRPKSYPRLNQPRAEARAELLMN